MLEKLKNEERTIILYESPMRLVKTLNDLGGYFGADRQCSVSRSSPKCSRKQSGNPERAGSLFFAKNSKGRDSDCGGRAKEK